MPCLRFRSVRRSRGLAVIISFSILDMYYLYEERLFRCLYQAICDGTVASFSMNKDAL